MTLIDVELAPRPETFDPFAISAGWTFERDDQLREYAEAGLSGSEAGRRLGVSRNAAIARANRIGVSFHSNETIWTGDLTRELKKLHAAGFTAQQIADTINVSRDAVTGKISRLGFPAKTARHFINSGPPSTVKPRKRAVRTIASRVDLVPYSVAPIPPTSGAVPQSRLIPHAELKPHHCQWPIGDPRESNFCFCGADQAEPGRPNRFYCAGHEAVAYRRREATMGP